MISVNAVKQLHPSAFEPVSADAAVQRRPLGRDVVVEKVVTELPHRQLWPADGMPQPHPGLHGANCRYQRVSPAAEALQLRPGFAQIRRLSNHSPSQTKIWSAPMTTPRRYRFAAFAALLSARARAHRRLVASRLETSVSPTTHQPRRAPPTPRDRRNPAAALAPCWPKLKSVR
jgi:hypothetical protein